MFNYGFGPTSSPFVGLVRMSRLAAATLLLCLAGCGGAGRRGLGGSGGVAGSSVGVGGSLGGTGLSGGVGGADTTNGGAGGTAAGASGSAGSPGGDSGLDGGAADSVVSPPTGNVTCGTAYKNPIAALAHDPSLVKYGNTYYAYSTCQTSLSAAPGCASVPKLAPFQTSTDKLHWTPVGNSMAALPGWTSSLGLSGPTDVWAPDIHVVDGKAYLYYSVSSWGDVTHSAVGLMTNTTLDPSAPTYRWVDEGRIVGAPEGGSGVNIIDADLFIDDDGRWWLVYGSFHAGVRVIELDPATGHPKMPITPASLTSGTGEGSGIIKNDGYYYLFLSVGTCCNGLSSTYEVIYGRATSVTGPYSNRTGGSINTAAEHLLPPGTDGNPGQGGQSFFKENNQVFMVYHAYQPPGGNPTLNIRPIYFDASDWVTLDPCKAKGYRP